MNGLPTLFKNYLEQQGVSKNTRKNYLADFGQFLGWLKQKTGTSYGGAGLSLLGLFTLETFSEYKANLLRIRTPLATINRHLSTLRKFCAFAKTQGWLKENPASEIKNVSKPTEQRPTELVIKNFRDHLQKERVSPMTIRNYLSDIRHFLAWLKVN
jgi:site-specific recombinase XerD